MDLDKDEKGNLSYSSCSICLDLVFDQGGRSIAKLHCGHEFHLDCIGSAFNAKGAMQCPNCRKVEKGRWLYGSGHRSSADFDFDFDAWMAEEFYDLGYSELPFGLRWCPFRIASMFEEGESQLNSYHEPMGNTAYGALSSASATTHLCPYLALHGHSHTMHTTGASSSVDSVPENSFFPHHPTNLLGGQPSADIMLNSNVFANVEPQNHNWQQQLHPSGQSAPQFGPRLSRNDVSSQQRLGSFVHTHPVFHGSGFRSGSSRVPSMGTQEHSAHRIYQPSVPHSSLRNPPFIPTWRTRPQGFAVVSSLAATSSSAGAGGSYGFASVSSSSANRSHQDPESMVAQHFDQLYGWGGREAPLPWITPDGESQWWGPFNPNPAPQAGGGSRPESGYQRMPPPPPSPRMPPPSCM